MNYGYVKPKPAASAVSRFPAVILFLAVLLFIAADLFLDLGFNWVDYVLVIVVALFGFKGYLRGLANTLFSLGGYVVGLVAAMLFSPKLALLAMEKTRLGQIMGDRINQFVPALSTISAVKISDTKNALDFIQNTPELYGALTQNPNYRQILAITSMAADTDALYANNVHTLNDAIVYSVLKIIALFVLFVGVKLIMVIIGRLLTTFMGTRATLGTANRTAGMLIGFGAGLLVCYVAFMMFIPMLGSINIIKIPEAYAQSKVLAWFGDFIRSIKA